MFYDIAMKSILVGCEEYLVMSFHSFLYMETAFFDATCVAYSLLAYKACAVKSFLAFAIAIDFSFDETISAKPVHLASSAGINPRFAASTKYGARRAISRMRFAVNNID